MRRNGIIETVFSLVLFLMFVVSSFFMLIYGAEIYQDSTISQEEREQVQIPLSYITTQIHQANSVTVKEVEGIDVLELQDSENTVLRIYMYQGYLKELYTKSDSSISLDAGTNLYSLDSFSVEKDGDLYTIEVNGIYEKVGVRS